MAELPGSEKDYAGEPKPSEFEAMPAGKYLVMVSSSEMKGTKAGDGEYLLLVLDVLEPDEFKGRKVFDRINLVNKSAEAVSIGQNHLKKLRIACGVDRLNDSNQLHGIPVVARLKIRKGDAQYQDSNDVADYSSAAGTAETAPAKPAPPKAAGGKPAWKR